MIERLAGFLLIPVLWFVVADVVGAVSPALLPPLSAIAKRFSSLVANGSLFADMGATGLRWVLGMSLGVFFGIVVGLIVGVSPRVRRLFDFPLDFLRALPVTAIFPLFLILFGVGDESKIAMAFMPTFLLMVVNTSYGVTLAEPARRRMARSFGASRMQIFFSIVTMDALPQIFIGLRLSLSMSLIVTVVSEMFIGTDLGLGQRVYDSYLTNSVATLYSLLIILGLVGYISNRALMLIERKVVFWTGTA